MGLFLGVGGALLYKHSRKWKPGPVWKNVTSGGAFASINAPTAGARAEKALPRGKHPYQLHSLATPNGVKVTILLEELGVEYDAWKVNIMAGEQFNSGFVALNPNSKIPALYDYSGDEPVRLFESGSILLHLAEKHGKFIPSDPSKRAECINWLMWQMSTGPTVGGGFGHFYNYAPEKFEYPINRFAMEVKRLLDVLDKHLANNRYLCGDEYTIADIALWPWYGPLVQGQLYGNANVYLSVASYTHVVRWVEDLAQRPAVQRGRMVNRTWGDKKEQLWERHEASDFDTQTQDKLNPDPAKP